MLFLALAVDTIAFALVFVLIHHCKRNTPVGELTRLSEAPVTGFLGWFAGMLAYFLPLSVLMPGAQYDSSAELVIAGFSVIIAISSCFTFMYGYVKCLVLLEDRLVFISPFGQMSSVNWSDITEVSVPFMRHKVVLKAPQGNHAISGGDPKGFKPFVENIKLRLPQSIDTYQLSELLAQI